MNGCFFLVIFLLFLGGFSLRCTCYLIRWLEISNRPGYLPPATGDTLLPDRLRAAAFRAVFYESLSSYLLLGLWLAGLGERLWRRQPVIAGSPGRVPDPTSPVVVLVPGYLMNRGTLWVLRRRLRRDGYRVLIFEPGSIRRSLSDHARCLGEFIAATLPAGTPVFLVGHSMGGLICRACALDYHPRTHPLKGLCTIGSPHGGTIMWSFGLGESVRDLRPGSAFLRYLEGRPRRAYPEVTAAIFSDFDELVIPNENARFPGAESLPVSRLGHFILILHPAVYRHLHALLSRVAAS